MQWRTVRNTSYFICLLLALLSSAQTIAAQAIVHQITLPSNASWCQDSMINGLFTQVNTFRSQNNVPALVMDTVGMKDAEVRATQFAAYMATNSVSEPGFNPHQGYDTTAASLGYQIISENLAYMTSDPAYVVYAAWQDTLHIAAMVARDANIAGVSCIISNGVPYWTYEPGCSPSFCGQSFPSTPPAQNPPPPSTTTGSTPTLDTDEANFLTLINNYRAQNGAGALQVSAALQSSSQWMSNDMATNNYAGHTDSLGRGPGTRLPAFGYPYGTWGENIAAGFADAQSALNGWINACDPDSTGACTFAHRQNMLNSRFVVIGIGRAFNANSTYGWYWTTDFGGVLDATISPSPSPASGSSAPTVTSFIATPSTINAGQSTTLSWQVTGATTLSVDGGVGNVTGLTSKTVAPAQTTIYTLTAANSAGSVTSRVTVTVNAAGDTQAPTRPSLTSATVKSATEVDLTWTASTDNVGVTGYQILRNGAAVVTVPNTVLSFADITASPQSSYSYTVKAFDAAKNYSVVSNTITVQTPALPVVNSCPGPAANAFTGCYYNNIGLTGSPVLVRTDNQINFNWMSSVPVPSVTAFSVRWQGTFSFDAGTYTFTAMMSDGMRLYVDGNLALNRWLDQAPTIYTVPLSLSQGNHLVTVEYYDETHSAVAQVSWQKNATSPTLPIITSFSAAPSTITAGQGTMLSWQVTGATTLTVDGGVGNVAGLTSKIVSPAQTTTYTLTAGNSAGSATSRVTITVNAAADTQPPTPPTLKSATTKSATEVDLSWTASTDNTSVTGYQILRNGVAVGTVSNTLLSYADMSASPQSNYTYTVKAFDAAKNYSLASNAIAVAMPALITASSCPGPAINAFTGCYYNNIGLAGNPVLVRADNQINFNWMWTPPVASLSAFSVRWQGNFSFEAGTYTFTAMTSDGMRLYIDGNLVLNRWRDQAPTIYTLQLILSQGTHLVTVEYYEQTRSGTAQLSWRKN